MGKSSIGSLPGYNKLFDDHYNNHHPGIISNSSFIIEIFKVPAHRPAENPDRKKEFGRFDKGINTENYNVCRLPQDDTYYASKKIDPAEIVKDRISIP